MRVKVVWAALVVVCLHVYRGVVGRQGRLGLQHGEGAAGVTVQGIAAACC